MHSFKTKCRLRVWAGRRRKNFVCRRARRNTLGRSPPYRSCARGWTCLPLRPPSSPGGSAAGTCEARGALPEVGVASAAVAAANAAGDGARQQVLQGLSNRGATVSPIDREQFLLARFKIAASGLPLHSCLRAGCRFASAFVEQFLHEPSSQSKPVTTSQFTPMVTSSTQG